MFWVGFGVGFISAVVVAGILWITCLLALGSGGGT